jgi:DNA-directed RNA polymerase specialized sigma24 family protein
VTTLYQAHALGLIRLAVVMLGDRPAAEDVVQEAFCGLYRRWHSLADTGKALAYVRSSVINGCRTGGTIVGVSAAGDDRTFGLDEQIPLNTPPVPSVVMDVVRGAGAGAW